MIVLGIDPGVATIGFVTFDIKKMRQNSLYDIDDSLVYRKSHENPEVIALYQDYLGAPLSEKAHHLLHTHYHKQKKATWENME